MHCMVRYVDSKRRKDGAPEVHIVPAEKVKNFEASTWNANQSYKTTWEGKDNEGKPLRARYSAQVLNFGPRDEMVKRLNEGRRITVPPLADGESISSESEESDTDRVEEKPPSKKVKIAHKEGVLKNAAGETRRQRAVLLDRNKMLTKQLDDDGDDLHNCQYKVECESLQEKLQVAINMNKTLKAGYDKEKTVSQSVNSKLESLRTKFDNLSELNLTLQMKVSDLQKKEIKSQHFAAAEDVLDKIETLQVPDFIPVENIKIEFVPPDDNKRAMQDPLRIDNETPKVLFQEIDKKVYMGTSEDEDVFIPSNSYRQLMKKQKLGAFINDAISAIWSSTKLINRSWTSQKGSRKTEWNTQEATPDRKEILYKFLEHKILADDPTATNETIKAGIAMCEPKFRAKVSTERLKAAKEKSKQVAAAFGTPGTAVQTPDPIPE